MEDPVNEIVPLTLRLIRSPYPAQLREDVERYFLPNAGFRHPLCYVQPGPNSRDTILGIYMHYRAISPHTDAEARVLAYDREKNLLITETVQRFHAVFSSSPLGSARLVTHLTLSQDPQTGLHHIAYQEDFYHRDHFVNLVSPRLAPLVRFSLKAAARICGILAPFENLFGLFSDPPEVHRERPSSSIPPIPTLQAIGGFLRAADARVRARGAILNDEDVVRTVPGEDELNRGRTLSRTLPS